MIIGLTGGVASGKTAVADELARLGARVIDADVIVHYLSNYDPSILTAIRTEFGEGVFTPQGALHRRRLGEIVFADAEKRRTLEQILHPPVMATIRANVEAARGANQSLIVVVPLLYEGGHQGLFDEVWVVASDPGVQIERLQARSGLSRERAVEMTMAQMPLTEKELLADRVLDNNGSLPELHQAVAKLWEELF